MIEATTRTVFRATTKGRTYLTKAAAIKAEARALIEKRHPTEKGEFDGNGYQTDPGWHWMNIHRSDVLYRRVCRLVKKESNV